MQPLWAQLQALGEAWCLIGHRTWDISTEPEAKMSEPQIRKRGSEWVDTQTGGSPADTREFPPHAPSFLNIFQIVILLDP
jgi:hypothetical protein